MTIGSRLKSLAKGSAVLALGGGAAAYLYAAPTYHACPGSAIHRPFDENDQAAMRWVGSGATVDEEHNPGVRVYPELVNEREARALLSELQPIKKKFGINLIQPIHNAIYRRQQSYMQQPPTVNMLRITGRPENEKQNIPAWKYGDEFDESKLPSQIKKLVARVRAIPGLKLGPLRDVTINYRHSGFLRLDPHVDPLSDGENVFILGLDSDTVLTLCPLGMWHLQQVWDGLWRIFTLADDRDLAKIRASQSWTSLDIDVLARKRAMVHLSGDARWLWTHGTRLGVEGLVPDKPGPHDFWGTLDTAIERGPERHSVVLAFAAPAEAESGEDA